MTSSDEARALPVAFWQGLILHVIFLGYFALSMVWSAETFSFQYLNYIKICYSSALFWAVIYFHCRKPMRGLQQNGLPLFAAAAALCLVGILFEFLTNGALYKLSTYQNMAAVYDGGLVMQSWLYFDRAALFLTLICGACLSSYVQQKRPLLSVLPLMSAALLLLIIFFSESLTARLSLGLMVAMFALSCWFKASFKRLVTVVTAVLVLGAVLLPWGIHAVWDQPQIQQARDSLPSSLRLRTEYWKFSSEKIAEKLAFGWGVSAGWSLPGVMEPLDWIDDQPRLQLYPPNPHSAFLEVLLGGGYVGLVLFLVLWVYANRLILKMPSYGQKVVFFSFSVVLAFVLSVWNVLFFHWIFQYFMAAILLVLVFQPAPPQQNSQSMASGVTQRP